MSMLGGIAIEQKGLPDVGDANNDNVVNVTDVVLSINAILLPMMASPYQNYASDYNSDQVINIADIVSLVSFILENQ